MQALDFSHNPLLIAASFSVALLAGFTGLTLTKGLSGRTFVQQKFAIALASIALGGGIWSMHFVAMLGLRLPILFYYDAAVTLASALLAILIAGCALILLHFRPRTTGSIALAGAIVAGGILTMHYVGMAGLELCRPVYSPMGIIFAVLAALILCIAAVWIAYGQRSDRNILLGTLCFALAVFAVHFVAIAGTSFFPAAPTAELGPLISNEVLALGVILSSFVIFGAFLWVGVTYLVDTAGLSANPAAAPTPEADGDARDTVLGTDRAGSEQPTGRSGLPVRIPCEKEGQTLFIDPEEVAFVRADGRYTHIYLQQGQLFCVWPITEAERRLAAHGFIRAHRSYLINPGHVTALERQKDKGLCRFGDADLPAVPVSRSKLPEVRSALGA